MRKILSICSTLSVVMLFTSALHGADGSGINTTDGQDYNQEAIEASEKISTFLQEPGIYNSLPNIINQHVDPAFASILSEAQALLASAEKKKIEKNPEPKLALKLEISSLPKNTADRFILPLNEYKRIVDEQSYLREAALLCAIQSVTTPGGLSRLSSKLRDIAKKKIPQEFYSFPHSAIMEKFAQNYQTLKDFITQLKAIQFNDADSFKKAFDTLPELSLDNAISMLTSVTNKDTQLVNLKFGTVQRIYLNMALLYDRLRSLRGLIDNIFVLDFQNRSRNLELFDKLIQLKTSIIDGIDELKSKKQILERNKNDYIDKCPKTSRAYLRKMTVDELIKKSDSGITLIQTRLKMPNTQADRLKSQKELWESLKDVLIQLKELESSISEQESVLETTKQQLASLNKISRGTIDELIFKPTDELEQIKEQIEKIPNIPDVIKLLGDEWYYRVVLLWHIIPNINELSPRDVETEGNDINAEIRDAFNDIYCDSNPTSAEQRLMKLPTSIATEAAHILTFAKEKANGLNLNFNWILGKEMTDLNFSLDRMNLFKFEDNDWFLDSIFLKLSKDSTFTKLCSVLNSFQEKKANNSADHIVLLKNILSYSIFAPELSRKYTAMIKSLILNIPQRDMFSVLKQAIPQNIGSNPASNSNSDSDLNGVHPSEWDSDDDNDDDDLDTNRSLKPTLKK